MINQDNTGIRPGLDVAVIGMAGEFPGSRGIKEFWENLKNGIESISFFSTGELEEAGIKPGKMDKSKYIKARGMLEDIEYFDASFFGYKPPEAEKMDPQMRVFHQAVWHALEDAGYVPDTYRGSIGLYGGATNNALWEVLNVRNEKNNASGMLAAIQFSDKDHMNTRISYKLNLTGPSLIMETQCSTSLVAVHLACQALLSGETDMALAGGVSIMIPKISGYVYQEGMILSPDGHCRAFDARANGTIFGNGVGIVVLKRIEDATAQGDHIYALIKGTAINNDGSRKAGYTAPSVEGQADVIRMALRAAQVDPETITYVETHGTGTTLGDPMEIEALNLAFDTDKKGFCRIGSLKPNVGHLDNAAGVASLIKAILALKHRLIPPSLHFESTNPKIDFDNSPFRVNRELIQWNNDKNPLRAGVSSFGIGGTNAHVVLEEWPGSRSPQVGSREPTHPAPRYHLIVLSARTPSALDRMSHRQAEHFRTNPGLNLADAAYTLQVGRKAFQYRRMLVCTTVQEAITQLTAAQGGKLQTIDTRDQPPPVAAMCSPLETGSAEGFRKMGAELYRDNPEFRREMDCCCEIFKPMIPPGEALTLQKIIGPDRDEEVQRENRRGTQPQSRAIIFSLQYALVKLLLSWGLQPRAIIGSGQGETTAACLRGDLSLEQALTKVVDNTGTQPGPHPGKDFGKASAYWLNDPNTLFMETGPGQSLIGFVKKHSGIKPGHRFIALMDPTQQQEPGQESPYRRLLGQVGQMWLYGVTPGWKNFPTAGPRQRVSLPGYCFEKQRYTSEYRQLFPDLESLQTTPALLTKKTAVTDWFYIPSWERSFFPPLPGKLPVQTWLLFMDNCGLGRALAKQLERQSPSPVIIAVSAGTAYEKISERQFVIEPREAGHYETLFKELLKAGEIPGKILHLWGVTAGETKTKTEAESETGMQTAVLEESHRVRQLGFYSLLNIVQALERAHITGSLGLEVITTGMQDVTGEDNIDPAKATVLGAVQVIPLEYPHIRCRSIDIFYPPPGTPGTVSPGMDALAGHLLAEFNREPNGRAVAFRGLHRWEQTYTPAPLEKPEPARIPFKPKGVYLITGGLGGMGLTFAEHLATSFEARLILVGRSGLTGPDRENPIRQKIRRWEQAGARVMIAAADVSDLQQMQEMVQRAQEQYGPIAGIIHAAGVADYDGVIRRRTLESTEKILAPKVSGTLVLDHILKTGPKEPDFLVLCSSISAIIGPFGEVGYTAANAFLDAYAHYRHARYKGRTVAINWGPWQEVGMAVDALKKISAKITDPDQVLKDALLPSEGVEVLCRAIASGYPRVAVSTKDLPAILRQQGQASTQRATLSRPVQPRPELATPYAPPTDEIEEGLVKIWEEFLGVENVGIHDNFFDLGASSLDLVQVDAKINEIFKTAVPVVILFENPTISSLARNIDQRGKEEIGPETIKNRSDELEEGKKLIQKRLRQRKN